MLLSENDMQYTRDIKEAQKIGTFRRFDYTWEHIEKGDKGTETVYCNKLDFYKLLNNWNRQFKTSGYLYTY